jgi:hypothetical protein
MPSAFILKDNKPEHMKKQTPKTSSKVVIVTPPIKDTKGQATLNALPTDGEMPEDGMENDDPNEEVG